MPEKGLRACNFCGKPESKVQSMFSAGDNNICDECVTYCYELLYGDRDVKTQPAKKGSSKFNSKKINLLKPAEIKKVLDEYVIGQDSAKISLAVSV